MRRNKVRTKKAGRTSRGQVDHASVLVEIRNRRYLAFVRAIVGAARSRNSSR